MLRVAFEFGLTDSDSDSCKSLCKLTEITLLHFVINSIYPSQTSTSVLSLDQNGRAIDFEMNPLNLEIPFMMHKERNTGVLE
jgi:hypothetical protein